ncbi:hypothetical protein CEB3_c29750 [Peptococcaceae bacterium CEB3]|nr:hypothetical protein CEB3_c29750 [Peptococcaceae bacterium CEB3]
MFHNPIGAFRRKADLYLCELLLELYSNKRNLREKRFFHQDHLLQAEIFPTNARSTATGSAYSLSRLSSGLLPFVLLPVLKSAGAGPMFGLVAFAGTH